MVSTFHGLETAKRGMTAQQTALYTTGHNIANANTEGYTRQRVDFNTSSPLRTTHGLIGTGVEPGVVQRIRNDYMDSQFRSENPKLGYYSSISTALSKMEDIMNEPSDSGLQAVMDKFWNSLQDLANNPQNSATRQVVASIGKMVSDTMNYYYNSLERIQTDLGNEIDIKVNDINTIVSQIDELNRQIAEVEPHGQIPNDLYDKRDLLVDELSSLVNVKVKNVIPDRYGQPAPAAVGLYEIEIVQADGSSYGNGIKLIEADGTNAQTTVHELVVEKAKNESGESLRYVEKITVGGQELNDLGFLGELSGLIESYGYNFDNPDSEQTPAKGNYPEMLEKLNKLAFAFATEFNAVHIEGHGLNQNGAQTVFFDLGNGKSAVDYSYQEDVNYAQIIKMNEDILNDVSKIAAALSAEDNSGDNGNVFNLADVKSKDFTKYFQGSSVNVPEGLSGSFDNYYASMIGELGVNAQSANRNVENVQTLVDSVYNIRQSVSGVSLDEEMTNLIKFQHAYNASARMITVVDEMLDRIINGMGVGGR